jgi:hypothetical protein
MVIAGAAWLVVAIVNPRFNYATVTAIATLFAFFCFVAAVNDLMVGVASSPGWRILHWLLAVAFIVVGVFAFIRPDPTFVGLAAVMSFYFISRGGFDIAMAIAGSGITRMVGPAARRPRPSRYRILGRRILEGVRRSSCLVGRRGRVDVWNRPDFDWLHGSPGRQSSGGDKGRSNSRLNLGR